MNIKRNHEGTDWFTNKQDERVGSKVKVPSPPNCELSTIFVENILLATKGKVWFDMGLNVLDDDLTDN